MKKLYFLVILFFAASCVKEDEAIDNPNIQQPVPEGAKEVIIIVDEGYDLTHTKALSLMGSSVMSGDTNKIAIPASFESATFFLQEETDEVLALVRTSPSNTTITVNGSTVSQALMTLVPAYHSMSKTSRDKFEREIISIPLYIDFVVIVDKLLKEGKPIYSTDLEFTNKLVELNAYINANYLETSDQRGSTLNYLEEKIYDKQQNEGDLNFSDWMTRENGGTVTNKVHSYVRVELEALSGGEMVASLLKPEPFGTGKTQLSLSTLNLKDNCYNVFLTQSHSDAISQNVLGAATTFADLFLNIVFGYMPGQGRNACIADIAGSVITDISTSVMQTANLSTWEMVDKTGMVAWGGIKTAATSTNCMKTFTNVATILNALGQQSAAILKVMQVLNYAQQSVEVTSYLIAIAKPLELNEIIQLYYRDLKEACIKVIDDKTLKEEYAPGEVIYPGIKLEAQSQYAEWIRSGFKVKWIAETGNGTTNLTESATNNEGKATIGWTLPDNLSGEVTLKAEILDKEGDHLEGSPIKFSTKVVEICDTNYNPPSITNVTRVCSEEDGSKFILLINFEASELPGFNPSGSYFGSLVTYPKAYPVRLEFMDAEVWTHSANGYKIELIEGNFSKGTIKVTHNLPGHCQQNEDYPYEHFWYNFRVFLVDSCGKQSNSETFETKYYWYY